MTESEKQEALESIALIRNLVEQSRRDMTHSGAGWISIIWGVFAFLGYGGSWLFHHAGLRLLSGLWWPFLTAVAFALSVMVIRRKSSTESSKQKGGLARFFMMFWIPLILLMAALVAVFGLRPDLPVEYIVPFIMLVVSTGYLMVGLMFYKGILAVGVLGFAGTIATALFFMEHAGWILALLFGLALTANGLILNRKG